MKTKKALAVLLAVVMLVMPLAVSSFAATENGIVAGPTKTAYKTAVQFKRCAAVSYCFIPYSLSAHTS
jgi:hypothetical protein